MLGKIPYINHARRHLPGGSDPLMLHNDWATRFSNFVTIDAGELVEPDMLGSGETSSFDDIWDYTSPEGWITTNAPGCYLLMQQVVWGVIGPPPEAFAGSVWQSWRADPVDDLGLTIATQYPGEWGDPGDAGPVLGVADTNLSAIMIVTSNIEGPITFIPMVLQASSDPQVVRVQQTIVRFAGSAD